MDFPFHMREGFLIVTEKTHITKKNGMAQKTETLDVSHLNKDEVIAICIGSFLNLGWDVKSATADSIVAHTPRKLTRWNDEVSVHVGDGLLTITSRLIHNELFDLFGYNKKNIQQFSEAFNHSSNALTEENLQSWSSSLNVVANQTMQDNAQLERLTNGSKGNMKLTIGIIACNVIVFLFMIVNGVSPVSPAGGDLIPYGGNFGPLTTDGEWWRIFTSTFLHFGIIHLALNMYALALVGANLEPILGKSRFFLAYLCTGLLASVASLVWHQSSPVVSAGASGAVFGMYGVFLALLTTNLIPKAQRKSLLQSILIFVGYNIIYGLKTGSNIDNAAHIGGLVSGMVIGYAYFISLRKGNNVKVARLISAAMVIATLIVVFLSTGTKQNQDYLFAERINEFGEAETRALNVLGKNDVTESDLETVALFQWQKAEQILKKTDSYNLSNKNIFIREKLKKYVDLRIKLTNLLLESVKNNTEAHFEEMSAIGQQIDEIINDLSHPPN